jgi:hypothetical protein
MLVQGKSLNFQQKVTWMEKTKYSFYEMLSHKWTWNVAPSWDKLSSLFVWNISDEDKSIGTWNQVPML